MPDNDLSQIECVLFEPETNVRHLLRDALGRLRIKNLQVFGHMEDVWKAFQGSNPDLLIADATSPDSETFKLVQSVRHSVVGGNPFLGIIITAFHPTAALLTKVTNCGADALLAKPVAFRQIQDRITALIEQPRNFVVTSDFIGPDRRKSPRESSQTPLLEVPNTLRIKATGSFAKANPQALIERSVRDINEQKLLRQAFQAAFLIEFAAPALSKGVTRTGWPWIISNGSVPCWRISSTGCPPQWPAAAPGCPNCRTASLMPWRSPGHRCCREERLRTSTV